MTEEHWVTRCRAYTYKTLEELEDELNKFCENHFVISSPIFQVAIDGHVPFYDCMVYYKVPPIDIKQEPKEQKKGMATPKQIEFLKTLGFVGNYDTLTLIDANKIIQELKKK